MTSLINQHNQSGNNKVDTTNAASTGLPTLRARLLGLGEVTHSPLANHDKIYEGPRYCLLLRANEITHGGKKPLPAHAWMEAKVKDLMRPNLDRTHTTIIDQTRPLLYCGPAELGEGLTMEEAQASVENFSIPSKWVGLCV